MCIRDRSNNFDMILIAYITMFQHATFNLINFNWNMLSYVKSEIIFLNANFTYCNILIPKKANHSPVLLNFYLKYILSLLFINILIEYALILIESFRLAYCVCVGEPLYHSVVETWQPFFSSEMSGVKKGVPPTTTTTT